MVPKIALFLLAALPLAAETALALRDGEAFTFKAVSYTHLTLPTIYSV